MIARGFFRLWPRNCAVSPTYSSSTGDHRKAVRPLRRYLRARVRTAGFALPSYTIKGDTTRRPIKPLRRGAMCGLLFFGRAVHVAAVGDASPEKISLVLPATFGAAGRRIADLTRREFLRSEDFAFPRHLRANGRGLGNSRQQHGAR